MNPIHTLLRLQAGLASRFRNVWFRALGLRTNGYVWMRRVSIPRNWASVTLEKGVRLDDGVVLLCSGSVKQDMLIIRRGTYVNRYTIFDAHEHLEIGRNCMIGPGCYLTDANHGVHLGRPVGGQPMEIEPVVLEDEVWLGAGVIVLSGVRVGQGAVVGAGAVVTKDVLPNVIVAGVPARTIGSRAEAPMVS